MPTETNPLLEQVDWSRIPAPKDDGAAKHLLSRSLPSLSLPSTDGTDVALASLRGITVLFAYPRTGRPNEPSFVPEWDEIPGARGCTPQSCAFRDLWRELRSAGVSQLFGLSPQDTEYQREAAQRLGLPFPLLSDHRLELTNALELPTMTVGGQRLLKRFALVLRDRTIIKIFYPVFPPDQNASEVLEWLKTGECFR